MKAILIILAVVLCAASTSEVIGLAVLLIGTIWGIAAVIKAGNEAHKW